MRRQSFAWTAFAVLALALLGDPRLGAALIHNTDAVEIVSSSSAMREPDLLEVPNIASPAPIESAAPVVAAPAIEPPTAPDSSAAKAEPALQITASAAVAAPPVRVAAVAAPVVRAAVVAPAPPAPAVRAVAPPPPPPATCPSDRFCYPRVGISGTIVPYGDCTGSTDVGTAIRSLTCVSPRYLAAHAYTQFGRIAGWRAGDIVFAYGVRYVIFDAFTQPGCAAPARAIAPLSLQTSLTSTNCGPILVVQGRPG